MSNGQHLPREMLALVNVWLLFVTNKASGNYLLHHECENIIWLLCSNCKVS